MPRPRLRGGARGVTLLELMAVVTIIGIFVALGFPAMGGVLEDRQTARGTEEITNMFRIARARSAATGAAHRVLANVGSPGAARFELRTALVGVGGPSPSCVGPLWTDTDSRSLQVVDFAPGSTGSLAGRDIQVIPLAGVSTALEFCFTPGGSSWIRDAGAIWKRPVGSQVTGWTVYRADKAGAILGLQRTIRIMPSGLPSIEAR